MEGKLEIKRPVRRLALIINQQEAMMTRMAHSHGDEDKEKDKEFPNFPASWSPQCLSNFFHTHP